MVKYYKKVEVGKSWEQPVLTSNGVWGGDSFAVDSPSYVSGYYPFYAFNGSTTGTSVAINGKNPYKMYFPIAVNISNIKSVGYHDSSWLLNSYRIAYSDDDITYTNATEILTATDHTINANIDKAVGCHKYWEIVPITCSSAGWSINELYIQAQELSYAWQECTKEEYDSLPDDQRKIVTDIYNGFVRKKILESKTVDVPFVQPILSSNGTLGGNSFAVYSNDTIYAQSNPAYYSVDGNDSTYCAFGVYNYEHIIMYNPVPIKISSIIITKNLANGAYYRFSASNDNINWTILQDEIRSDPKETVTWSFPDNQIYYKYFKLEGKNTSGGNIQIVNMKLEGTIKATIPTRAITMYYNHKRISGYRDYSINFTDSNIQTVGTLTIDNNGVASEFSNANYCQLPEHFVPSSNWEMNMCVQPHSTATLSTSVNWWESHAMILGIPNGYYGWVDPTVYTKQPNITMLCTTNSIQIMLNSSTYDGGSTEIGTIIKTGLTLSSDKFYDIKINFTGTSYIAQYREYGTNNWITLGTISSSTKIGECQLLVGHSYQGITGTGWIGVREDYFNGKIDLFNSYIKVNNQLWWSNKQEIKSGSIITNYLEAH